MAENQNQGQWYVAITQHQNGEYDFLTAYGGLNESAKAFIERHGLRIVAEKQGLTESDMDWLTGIRIKEEAQERGYIKFSLETFDSEDVEPIGALHLENLAGQINQGRITNPQNALDAIYESKP